MNTLDQMEQLLREMRVDAAKLYEQNVKAYAVPLREKALMMKDLAQQVRVDSLNYRNGIVGHGKNKTVGGAPILVSNPVSNPVSNTAPEQQMQVSQVEPQPSSVSVQVPVQVPVQLPVQKRGRQPRAKVVQQP